mmetsp:Transcript_10287/g.24790  ORF Transcript_10287/g.24790 Transcript_10287/m.24790 type:complete len:419 (-) Transcript_10287:187-1443(-)
MLRIRVGGSTLVIPIQGGCGRASIRMECFLLLLLLLRRRRRSNLGPLQPCSSQGLPFVQRQMSQTVGRFWQLRFLVPVLAQLPTPLFLGLLHFLSTLLGKFQQLLVFLLAGLALLFLFRGVIVVVAGRRRSKRNARVGIHSAAAPAIVPRCCGNGSGRLCCPCGRRLVDFGRLFLVVVTAAAAPRLGEGGRRTCGRTVRRFVQGRLGLLNHGAASSTHTGSTTTTTHNNNSTRTTATHRTDAAVAGNGGMMTAAVQKQTVAAQTVIAATVPMPTAVVAAAPTHAAGFAHAGFGQVGFGEIVAGITGLIPRGGAFRSSRIFYYYDSIIVGMMKMAMQRPLMILATTTGTSIRANALLPFRLATIRRAKGRSRRNSATAIGSILWTHHDMVFFVLLLLLWLSLSLRAGTPRDRDKKKALA